MINKTYFGASGLTSTSASYLANLAQEQVKANESLLEHLHFDKEVKSLLSQGIEYVTRESNVDSLKAIDNILRENSNYYWFIAWVKSAIKEKEKAANSLPSFSDWVEGKLPEPPQEKNRVYEENIIAEFEPSKLARYYRLQQFAAVFGKMIHDRGSIAVARKTAYTYQSNPTSLDKLDNDVILTRHELKFTIEQIDEMYNELQAYRREFDKQLNQIKFEILNEVNRRNKDLDLEYQKEYEQWRLLRDQLRNDYNIWYRDAKEEISLWKIVIPEELQDTMKYLQSLGKVQK